MPASKTNAQLAIFAWGVGGIAVLLIQALARLTPLALEAVASPLSVLQWVILLLWVVLNAHAEGYRGFQRRFSPRTVARAAFLAEQPTAGRVLLAPLFCMGLFAATRRVLIAAWGVLIGVTCLVLWVRTLSQPWRGIIDAGVVVGLGWGLISLLVIAAAVWTGRRNADDPELG